MHTGKELEAH